MTIDNICIALIIIEIVALLISLGIMVFTAPTSRISWIADMAMRIVLIMMVPITVLLLLISL